VIALWLAMLAGGPPPVQLLPPVGRVYSSATLHVGVRAAFLITPLEQASGVTIQVSSLWFL
jgi:hypothetical protein